MSDLSDHLREIWRWECRHERRKIAMKRFTEFADAARSMFERITASCEETSVALVEFCKIARTK